MKFFLLLIMTFFMNFAFADNDEGHIKMCLATFYTAEISYFVELNHYSYLIPELGVNKECTSRGVEIRTQGSDEFIVRIPYKDIFWTINEKKEMKKEFY